MDPVHVTLIIELDHVEGTPDALLEDIGQAVVDVVETQFDEHLWCPGAACYTLTAVEWKKVKTWHPRTPPGPDDEPDCPGC